MSEEKSNLKLGQSGAKSAPKATNPPPKVNPLKPMATFKGSQQPNSSQPRVTLNVSKLNDSVKKK